MNLTPNFNLIQPETTDLFADFRAWYNQTLSIIDANLGGGGSKHTIVDENGQALPNRTYLEFAGGVQVTDDAVNNKTVVDITGGGGGSSSLAGLSDVNLQTPTDGQVLTYDNASQKWVNANSSGGGSYNYSTSEQVIGTWLDGRPIYQKTVAVTSNVPYNTWQSTGVIVDPSADAVISVPQAKPQTGSSNMQFLAYFNSGELVVMNMRNTNYGTNYSYYITVQYTKSTD